MPTIVVDVMPKAELLDPQGKAVSGAFSRLGVDDSRLSASASASSSPSKARSPTTSSPRPSASPTRSSPTPSSRTSWASRSWSRSNARIGVITFPGSLDDRDAQRAIRIAGAEPVALWHGSHDLEGVDALVLPGGFSYGDYLRAGAIAALAPIMAEVKDAAAAGMPILGICNGFQMLVEAHLLPGGLIRNAHQQFVRRDQRLRVENTVDRVDLGLHRRPGDRHPAQERRWRLHRLGCRARPARGRGPRRLPLRRREPQRVASRHRGHRERARQCRRPHAASRARRRARLRPRHGGCDALRRRRPSLLHERHLRCGRAPPPEPRIASGPRSLSPAPSHDGPAFEGPRRSQRSDRLLNAVTRRARPCRPAATPR